MLLGRSTSGRPVSFLTGSIADVILPARPFPRFRIGELLQ
jgi:hypothetical protein